MDKKLIGLDLSHIAEGGLQEKLDLELEKVFNNILDLNTDAKAKRTITITLRCHLMMSVQLSIR